MPTEVTSWKANDGTLHEDECEAAKRDLELLVADSPLNENQPYARLAVEWLCQNHDAVRVHLVALARACVSGTQDSLSLDGAKGPIAKDPQQ